MIKEINSVENIKNIEKMIHSFFNKFTNHEIIDVTINKSIPIKKILQMNEYTDELSKTNLFKGLVNLIKQKKENGFFLINLYGKFSDNERKLYFIPFNQSNQYPNYIDIIYPHTILSENGDWCVHFFPDNFGILVMKNISDFEYISTYEKDINNLIYNYLIEIKDYYDSHSIDDFFDKLDKIGFKKIMINIYGVEDSIKLLSNSGFDLSSMKKYFI